MIGVLGLQGDYEAHRRMLDRLSVPTCIIKRPEQLSRIQGLIIPGGESTTLIKLIDAYAFWQSLADFARAGNGIFGTCAGMILLAKEALNPSQRSLGLIDITVERNSYGRQRESFESSGVFLGNETELPMIFIRAPRILRLGQGVKSVATCRDECVMARQDKILVAAFHPELTDNPAIHEYFVEVCTRR